SGSFVPCSSSTSRPARNWWTSNGDVLQSIPMRSPIRRASSGPIVFTVAPPGPGLSDTGGDPFGKLPQDPRCIEARDREWSAVTPPQVKPASLDADVVDLAE